MLCYKYEWHASIDVRGLSAGRATNLSRRAINRLESGAVGACTLAVFDTAWRGPSNTQEQGNTPGRAAPVPGNCLSNGYAGPAARHKCNRKVLGYATVFADRRSVAEPGDVVLHAYRGRRRRADGVRTELAGRLSTQLPAAACEVRMTGQAYHRRVVTRMNGDDAIAPTVPTTRWGRR